MAALVDKWRVNLLEMRQKYGFFWQSVALHGIPQM
jgi:hypothetical protein